MKARTPSGQVYRIRRRWALWRWRSLSASMPLEVGVFDFRGGATQDVAAFALIVALIQAILMPVLLPLAIVMRSFFGKPWMVQVRWADMATELKGGSWSESGELIRSLVRQVEETGSLIGSPVDPS